MMQCYESYKPSGLNWLGDIPSHWNLKKSKFLWREKEDRSLLGNEELLSVSQYSGVVPRAKDSRSESLEDYKRCEPNDLIINIMLAWMGGLGVSKHSGIVSPAYCVYRQLEDHNPSYFDYLYRTPQYLGDFARRSKGVVPSRWRMYTEDFGQVLSLLPSREEQDRIVAFLDQKTAEIDTAIAKKERLIELLNEQKHVLINHAITKGLNPIVQLRDSGFLWIGFIPAHWNILRFKYCASITSGQVDPRRDPYASMPLIAPNHIEPGTGKLLQIETAREQGADSGKYQLEAGDLIYSKIRPALRKVCISPVAGLCSADMYVLRPRNFINKRYLLGYLLTDAFTQPALDAALRVAMPKVNREALGDFPVLVPPLDEQEAIASFMLTCDERFNPVIDAAKGEIVKLSELRALLIASVASGKIKV